MEEVRTEGGREVWPPARVAVVAAVIENPWAGQGFVEDLGPGIDATASDLGALLAPQVLEALEGPVEAYGKAAIVGLDGEIEHGSGLIHTLKFGDHFRKAANATTLLPAVEKLGEELGFTVVNMRFVKPLDRDLILELARSHEGFVTIEDNAVQGGAGSAVAELLAAEGMTLPLLPLGLPDLFLEHASREQVLAEAGLDVAGIRAAIQRRWPASTWPTAARAAG